MGSVASPPAGTIANLNSILQRSQGWLYWNYGWEALRSSYTISPLIVGTAAYNAPANMEPRKIISATLVAGATVTDLREGIPPQLRYSGAANARPTRYQRQGAPGQQQIVLWPPPDLTTYVPTFDAYQSLDAFAADTDTSTLDDDAIMELSIALAKMHYGMADGAASVQLVNALLTRLNGSDETTGRIDPFTSSAQLAQLTGVQEKAVQMGMF